MSGKIAIVINSGWDQKDKVTSGLGVSKRIFDAKEENQIDAVEVFLFTGAVKLLESVPPEVDRLLSDLKEVGLVVGACSNQVNNWNLTDPASKYGIHLEFARDAFSRYAREAYTVLTF
ncbi:hypothetical protein LLE49_14340 [Alicyclobacillus tolerans]|uniref:hypothetical protein n=1 Tax=Alicyclobacillus tolerans TaxID=90970 RepID=UPI001F4116FE|nr:hypothetical protein [Alicyclobacillus tolerans]MCF8565901.1 hypothetical protein [Alicyclobacillus tolerans]